MKRLYILQTIMFLSLAFVINSLNAQNAFITEWKYSSSPPASIGITVPLHGDYYYDLKEKSSGTSIVSGNSSSTLSLTLNSQVDYILEITPNNTNGTPFHQIRFGDITNGANGTPSYILKITQWGDTKWSSFESAFSGCANMDVVATDIPDLGSVTDMSLMFSGCKSLVGNKFFNDWKTDNVTTMAATFNSAILFNQDLSSWNTSSVKDMSGMFALAMNFNHKIGAWKTGNVENMNGMFYQSLSFNQDISAWDVSKVKKFGRMFAEATSFNQNINLWNTSSATNMQGMFTSAKMFNQALDNWKLDNVTDVQGMFDGTSLDCENYGLTLAGWVSNPDTPDNLQLGAKDKPYSSMGELARGVLIKNKGWKIDDANTPKCDKIYFTTMWNTESGTDFEIPTYPSGTYRYNIFYIGPNTTEAGMSKNETGSYKTPSLTSRENYYVFIWGDFPRIYFNNSGDKDLIKSVISWGDIKWESFENAFYGCRNLELRNKIDVPDLRNVKSLAGIFRDCKILTGNGCRWDWNTKTIIDMNSAFSGAELFNQDLARWETDNVTNMRNMFQGASHFNQSLLNWKVNKVKDMNGMFHYATSFETGVKTWDVSNVTNMADMFSHASAFKDDISSWKTQSVKEMNDMFSFTKVFNSDIGRWDVERVINMNQMFREAISFNQDLNGWKTDSLEQSDAMFVDASSFNQDLSNWNLRHIISMVKMFNGSAMDCINLGNTLYGWFNNPNTPNTIDLGVDKLSVGGNLENVIIKFTETIANGGKGWKMDGLIIDKECPVIWYGTKDIDWAESSNWQYNMVPPAKSNILIAEDAKNEPNLDRDGEINELDFNKSNKKVVLGDNTLTATGFKNFNDKNYVKTNGKGKLKINVPNKSRVTFPVGNSAFNYIGIGNLNKNDDEFSVRVLDEAYEDGLTGKPLIPVHVRRTWDIDKENPNTGEVTLNFSWNSGEESGPMSAPTLNHYNSSTNEWEIPIASDRVDVASTKLNFYNYTGDFSPFTIGDGPIPLPVDYIYFEAIPNNYDKTVELNWQTAQEINNSHFEILRSSDLNFWTKIGEINGNGNSYSPIQYSFYDNNPLSINYYKLKQVDFDGNFEFSKTKFVKFNLYNNNYSNLTIYPNPTSATVSLESYIGNNYEITDVQGRVLISGEINNIIENIDISILKPGIYFVKTKTAVAKLIKE